MTEKELKKLRRVELLEIMLNQAKEIERLHKIIEKQKRQLEDRRIRIEKAGTIAEAAFALNGVMEAVQAAADQYLENLKMMSEEENTKI